MGLYLATKIGFGLMMDFVVYDCSDVDDALFSFALLALLMLMLMVILILIAPSVTDING